ncbi:MAG TPA: trigger factor [Candidatus Micrarchaeia archaeon]|nr:trigger factor [Candidatus Micrarchaeia archaeon]
MTTPLEVAVDRRAGSEAVLTVVAPAAEVERAVERAIRRLAGQVRIAGFRPGHAPRAVLERTVGWPAIRQETVDLLLPEVWARALAETGLEPVTPPEVGEVTLEQGEPFQFTATVVVRPEVELGGYRALRVPLRPDPVTGRDVEAAVELVQREHAVLFDAGERPIQAGDRVTADLTMHRDGQAVGGGGRTQTLDLDPGVVLPGLADALIGLRVGEALETDLTLPEDYPEADLRGARVTVRGTVRQAQAKELPPIDDNLASIAGLGESLDDLRTALRERLQSAAAELAASRRENLVLEEALRLASVEVPEAMIQREVDRQLRDLELRLGGAGISVEQYLQATGQSLEQVRGQRRQPATERVKLELTLEAVARAEGLEVADPDVEGALGQLFRRGDRARRDQARPALRRELLWRKATDRLVAIADGQGEAGPDL